MALDIETRVVLILAHRLVDLATERDNIPFRSGDLRKSIDAKLIGPGSATVGSSLPYARAVHDGRPAITIRPNLAKNPPYGHRKHRDPKKARLKFTIGGKLVFARAVRQGPRKPNPFLHRAARELKNEIAALNAGQGGPLQPINQRLQKVFSDKLMKDVLKRVVIDI